jgi:hypothetical protein
MLSPTTLLPRRFLVGVIAWFGLVLCHSPPSSKLHTDTAKDFVAKSCRLEILERMLPGQHGRRPHQIQ